MSINKKNVFFFLFVFIFLIGAFIFKANAQSGKIERRNFDLSRAVNVLSVGNGGTGLSTLTNGILRSSGNVISTDAYSSFSSCVTTVTLVGGSGNTVPVYAVNDCQKKVLGDMIWWMADLSGDGGAEGAGTGVITLTLPETSSSTQPASGKIHLGMFNNGASNGQLVGVIGQSATTVTLEVFVSTTGTVTMAGSAQNNATRAIRINTFYKRSL